MRLLSRGPGRPSPVVEPDPPAPDLASLSRGLSWPLQRPVAAFFNMVEEAIGSETRVAVVAGQHGDVWAELLALRWPDLDPVIVRDGDDPSEAHVRLTLAGPFDVVVHDATGASGLAQARDFQRVFMHLREHGSYLTPRLVPAGPDDLVTASQDPLDRVQREDGPREGAYRGDLWSMVAEAQEARTRDLADVHDVGLRHRDVRGLAHRLLEVHVHSKMLRISPDKSSQPKLTEPELDAVLASRPEIGREITHVDGAVVDPPEVEHNLGSRDPWLPTPIEAPRMVLREYDAPVCSRGQVVTSHGLLLPDSFRFPTAPRMTNIYVEESAPRFGYVRRDLTDPEPLAGRWFHLDSEWPGQFGHMLTERVGRMWAWAQVKRDHPDVKVLLTPHDRPPTDLHAYEVELFEALGVPLDELHFFERPCRPEVLFSASPMFSLSEYVHPALTSVWHEVGDRLAHRADDVRRPERLFMTRPPSLKRGCRNSAAVEELFTSRGFEVIRPEEHSLADQVAFVRAAKVIAGFVGSGLYTAAFRPDPIDLVTVGPTSYTARNEQLIAALLGHRVTAVWSEPEIPHPPGAWSQEAFFSGFTFDVDREGAFLVEALDRL